MTNLAQFFVIPPKTVRTGGLAARGTHASFSSSRVRQELATEVGRVNASISEAKAELIRWMFIFWIGQIGALLGILFAFFRK